MGTFMGHAIPGAFLGLFGLWWTVQLFNRYYESRRRSSRFTSTATFNCTCLCGKLRELPLEAFIKIIFVGVGFTGEMITGFSEGQFVHYGNGQHATLFFIFGFTGIVDILVYYKAPLPPDMDYAAMLMAIVCEFIQFKFHLHGRTELDILLHTLLLYAVASTILAFIAEMKYRNNILVALTRAYMFLLQGTWFLQIGWILYPPFKSSSEWAAEDHDQMMLATMMFAWHAAIDMLLMLSIGGVIACLHRRSGGYMEEDSLAMKRLIHTGRNGETVVQLHEDSESEIEFEKAMLH